MSAEEEISKLLIWRGKAPKFTAFRINLLVTTPSCVIKIIEHSLCEVRTVVLKINCG